MMLALNLATALEAADMLNAFAQLISFPNVTVNEAVRGNCFAARLSRLMACMGSCFVPTNFTTCLKLAAGDRTKARLNFSFQRLGRSPS